MPEPDETQHRDEANGNPEPMASGVATGESPLTLELSVSPNSIEGLFLQALQFPSPADRDAFLDRSCHNEPENRKRVLALLRAHADAGDFLENPAVDRPTNESISLGFLKPSDKEGVLGTIGPYEVLEAIGRGGMGVVLRAVDPKLNRIVAVKALLPELASNPNSRRRFLREAQAAAAISHPQVVSIHAVDDSDQNHSGTTVPPFLVMECIVGQSLQQKLDKVGPLRLTEILRISRQISDGLAAAHKQGLVHRDIKPANILLENGVERVKITDFGLARAIDDITVTRTGEVCGTPQYMSPEQACGDRVDHRSDLFSLGCVMYAMCTGHSPFRGDSIAHVIKRVTQDEPRSIADQNPEIPAWLTEIINALLQKKAEHRFQSAEVLAAILDQHLSRIQHPSESGSHSAINQQLSASGSMGRLPSDEVRKATSLNEVAKEKGGLATKIDTRWLSYRFVFLSVILVVASMLILPLLWLASLAVRDAINGNSISILNQYFWTSVFAQKLPTLAALGAMIAATSLILFAIHERQQHRRLTINQQIPSAGTISSLSPKFDSLRFRVSNALLWVGIPALFCSVFGLVALWNNWTPISISNRPEVDIEYFTFGGLIIGMITLLTALFLRVRESPSGPTGASLLLFFMLGGPIGIVLWLILRDSYTRRTAANGSRQGSSMQIDTYAMHQAPASENVYMQFGRIITPVPLAAALHYTTVKSISRAWILLTLAGVIFSLVLHPTLSLATSTTQLFSQAFQYPGFMLGTWIMGMLGTKIFTPRVPLRTWALLSSTMLGCMVFGYFWTTVARMPFSGNLNELSSRSLMGAAIIPTLIFLLYCSWVYLEIIKNPEALQGVRNLTGPQARFSNRTFIVLITTVLLVLGLVSLLFKIGSESNAKHPAPPTVEVRKEGTGQSESYP